MLQEDKRKSRMATANRIDAKFSELADRGECGLICYVVAGYPDLRTSQAVVEKLVEGGADLIEIGIPFSDPIADGPTIQAASHAALEAGVTPEQALALASRVRKKFPSLPLLAMTYANILARKGFEKSAKDAKKAGIDGFIIPDLPVEEAGEYVTAAGRHGLATVFLAAPNTASQRLKHIINASTGFLYLVSVLGLTGARAAVEKYTLKAVTDAKRAASGRIPLAVGFGISSPEHVMLMRKAGADAVIVGSSIVDMIRRSSGKNNDMLRMVGSYARAMKTACKKHTKTH